MDLTRNEAGLLTDMSMAQLRAEATCLGVERKFRSKQEAVTAIRAARRSAARTKPGGPGTIREAAERILRKPIPYSQALDELKQLFPEANTSVASLRWYNVQMRKRGERMPRRPYDIHARAAEIMMGMASAAAAIEVFLI